MTAKDKYYKFLKSVRRIIDHLDDGTGRSWPDSLVIEFNGLCEFIKSELKDD